MTCNCGGNVEFTLAKDISSGWMIMQACCEECGKSATGYGKTVEDTLTEVKKNWLVNPKRRKRTTGKPSIAHSVSTVSAL